MAELCAGVGFDVDRESDIAGVLVARLWVQGLGRGARQRLIKGLEALQTRYVIREACIHRGVGFRLYALVVAHAHEVAQQQRPARRRRSGQNHAWSEADVRRLRAAYALERMKACVQAFPGLSYATIASAWRREVRERGAQLGRFCNASPEAWC